VPDRPHPFTNPNPRTPNPCLYAALYRPPGPHQPAVDANTLVQVAGDFSPRYERHSDDLVSIDVSGLQRLLKVKEGLAAQTIGAELHRDAASRGMHVHVAVAGTRMAAVVIALATPGVTIAPSGEEASALASIPIGILEKVASQKLVASQKSEVRSQKNTNVLDSSFGLQTSDFRLQTFTRWGLATLGELAALPDADLMARLGRPARLWQAIARGDDVRPLVPTLADERFESTIELEWPIEGLEPLSFVLTRLIEPLSTRLERRDRGAAVLHVLLGLVTKDMHTRRLELPSPMRDVRTLRTLALLDLESHPPSAAIDRVTIVIDPTPGRVLQHTLFTRAHPTPEQLSTLIARLGALMGQDRFGAPALVDSYRPGAFAMAPFATEHGAVGAGKAGKAGKAGGESTDQGSPILPLPPFQPFLPSAVRRCRHPVPARVVMVDDRPVRVTTDRRGFAGGTVIHCAGPWRSSGQWWAGEAGKAGKAGRESPDQGSPILPFQPFPPILPWNVDEWDVSLTDGGVYRIFRNLEADAWFIDAVID
jgi:protein ImuB